MVAATAVLRGVAIVFLLSAVITPLSVSASNGPRVCNRTSEVISLAIAWWGYDSPGLHSKGWYKFKPGECSSVFPNDSYEDHRYYYAESQTWVWKGDGQGAGYCVHPKNRFEIADADVDCPAPYDRRSFRFISGDPLYLDQPK